MPAFAVNVVTPDAPLGTHVDVLAAFGQGCNRVHIGEGGPEFPIETGQRVREQEKQRDEKEIHGFEDPYAATDGIVVRKRIGSAGRQHSIAAAGAGRSPDGLF